MLRSSLVPGGFGKISVLAVFGGAAALCHAAAGGADGENGADRGDPAAAPGDEMVVVGSMGELRRELRLAEEAVFNRFNEINSDDAFDIHCLLEPRYGSRIRALSCRSNSWREQEANYGTAVAREMQGAPPRPYRASPDRASRRDAAGCAAAAATRRSVENSAQSSGAPLRYASSAATRPEKPSDTSDQGGWTP